MVVVVVLLVLVAFFAGFVFLSRYRARLEKEILTDTEDTEIDELDLLVDNSVDGSDSCSPRFLSNSTVLKVAGFCIDDPMVYVSEKIDPNKRLLPHIVYTSLPVDNNSADGAVTYLPSYLQITARDRYTFLQWLAAGKNTPDINIGFVFIYLYGLEFRAICEGKDKRMILQEVLRLQEIYGDDNSFKKHTENFLTWMLLSIDDWSDEERDFLLQFTQSLDSFSPLNIHGVKFHLLPGAAPDYDDLFFALSVSKVLPGDATSKKIKEEFKEYFLGQVKENCPAILTRATLERKYYCYHCVASVEAGFSAKTKINAYKVSFPEGDWLQLKRMWRECFTFFENANNTTDKKEPETEYLSTVYKEGSLPAEDYIESRELSEKKAEGEQEDTADKIQLMLSNIISTINNLEDEKMAS